MVREAAGRAVEATVVAARAEVREAAEMEAVELGEVEMVAAARVRR